MPGGGTGDSSPALSVIGRAPPAGPKPPTTNAVSVNAAFGTRNGTFCARGITNETILNPIVIDASSLHALERGSRYVIIAGRGRRAISADMRGCGIEFCDEGRRAYRGVLPTALRWRPTLSRYGARPVTDMTAAQRFDVQGQLAGGYVCGTADPSLRSWWTWPHGLACS